MKIAVLGCGEVGLLYAKALAGAGHTMVCCDPKPRQAGIDFCADAAIPLHASSGAWLEDVDAAISCVLGTVSLTVAREAMPHLRGGALFADMTTCDPDDIRTAAREARERDLIYADIAIMGAIALSGLRTNLLGAGPGAEAARNILTAAGAPMRVIEGGEAGDAAALKILRSVFTKGLEALAVECFLAAEKQGVTDKLYDALADIDRTPLRATLEALVRTHVIHAPRRLKEVEEAERQLHKAGLPVDVLPGVRARFERTSRFIETNPIAGTAPDVDEAFAWLMAEGDRNGPPTTR